MRLNISTITLKRYLKTIGYRWIRARRSLKHRRDPEAYIETRQKLIELETQHAAGKIDLFYFDESGIGLQPTIPYAWTPEGERLELVADQRKRIQLLGFVSPSNEFYGEILEHSVKSKDVINVIDRFAHQIKNKTYIILDNASIHKSKMFKICMEAWQDQGLEFVFLPPYSPELNRIELLWKQLKYFWFNYSVFSSPKNLYTRVKREVERIMRQIGRYYKIHFQPYTLC